MSPTSAVYRLAICVLLWAPASAHAQVAHDLGFGMQLWVPKQFESDPCGPLFGVDVRAGLSVDLPWSLVAESAVSVSGSTIGGCDAGDAWIPPLNGTTRHLVFADGLAEEPYVTVSQRLAFDLKMLRRAAPRVFLGGGRFLGKGTWFWSTGLGVRFGPIGSAKVLEVERMAFRLGFVEEFRVRQDGVVVDRYDSGPMKLDESMWTIRLRIPVGG